MMEDNVYPYELERKIASFRSTDFTFTRMATERKELEEYKYQQARKDVEEDVADVAVLGCTVASGFAETLMGRLKISLVDPVIVSFK